MAIRRSIAIGRESTMARSKSGRQNQKPALATRGIGGWDIKMPGPPSGPWMPRFIRRDMPSCPIDEKLGKGPPRDGMCSWARLRTGGTRKVWIAMSQL